MGFSCKFVNWTDLVPTSPLHGTNSQPTDNWQDTNLDCKLMASSTWWCWSPHLQPRTSPANSTLHSASLSFYWSWKSKCSKAFPTRFIRESTKIALCISLGFIFPALLNYLSPLKLFIHKAFTGMSNCKRKGAYAHRVGSILSLALKFCTNILLIIRSIDITRFYTLYYLNFYFVLHLLRISIILM